MHKVSTNYTLPTVLNSLKPGAIGGPAKGATAKASTPTGTTGTTGSTPSSSSANSVSTTFLNLLSQELQNQDPTAPVDSTAMVGQMISLNQLDQLISINQTVTGSSTTLGGLVQPGGATAIGAALPAASGAIASTLSPSMAAASQLPFDPNTMMPLTSGDAGALAASVNSSINAATKGVSSTRANTNTNNSGGK